jgi:GNAT superfamily N-acetyltransferase
LSGLDHKAALAEVVGRTMNVTIRPAAASEADTLTALALAGKRHWGYPESWLDAWRGLLTITPEYLTANVVHCAEDGAGRVVGFYALERDGASFRLDNLFLAPSAIGNGLGRQLFEHAVQEARALGAAELLIEADPNAEGFYRHMGAQRIGETVSRVTGSERIVPQLRYVLPGPARSVCDIPGEVAVRGTVDGCGALW